MTEDQDGDFALVIGIKYYPHLRDLDAPVRDANRVAEWLRVCGGLPEANVELVVSGAEPEERPILAEIDHSLYRILKAAKTKSTVQPGWQPRRLYVYFAGHGCSRHIEHLALLMANADSDRINRAMNAAEYRAALATRMFSEQVYWFDCCRNYDFLVRGRGPELTVDDSEPPVRGLTQVVMYAAGFTEYANERHLFYDERRGLFTQALLEGLQGAAATGDPGAARGIVFTDRLETYVRDRLDAMTRAENIKQTLWTSPLGSPSKLVLARGVTLVRQRVRVDLPGNTTRVVVRDADERTHTVRNVPPGATSGTFDLELAYYTFTAEPSGASRSVRLLPGEPDSIDLRSATCRG